VLKNPDSVSVMRGGLDVSLSEDVVNRIADCYVDSVSDTPEEANKERGDVREIFSRAVKDPKTVLVFDGDKLIGFGMWEVDGVTKDGAPVCEWRRIVVLPSHRGFRVGDDIVSNLESDIMKNDPRSILVSVTKTMHGYAVEKGYRKVPYPEFADLIQKDNGRIKHLSETGYSILVKDSDVADERNGFGNRMRENIEGLQESDFGKLELHDFNPKGDMDYFYQLEGTDGWIALGMENCRNQRYYIVIGENGEKLGVVGVYDTDSEKNITHIVVDPKYRGRGLPSKFYQVLLEKTGLEFLIATISRSNIASVRAHEKAGFRKVSDPAYEDEYDKFKYRKGL